MANKVGWGQGSVNNDIGWGQGAVNNSVDWGNIHAISPSGETNIVGGGAPVEQLLLDEYPNAAAAYSLRDLASASVGSAVVRVRRSSDNTEQDFTATEITDGTLTTFTGANDGFVATWYDQSGNSNNATQATATNQPKIIISGVLQLENGKPTVNSTSTVATNLQLSAFSGGVISQPLSIITVGNFSGGNDNVFNDINSSGIYDNGNVLNAGTSLSHSYPINSQINVFYLCNTTTSEIYYNSIFNVSGNVGTNSQTGLTLFNRFIPSTNNAQNGNMQEFIIYPSNESANRSGIESNINSHYNIYP